MAKTKKAVKKSTPKRTATPKHHHHWHPHDFLIVVAGGFIVIIIVFLMSDSFRSTLSMHKDTKTMPSQSAMELDSANEKTITIQEFTYAPDPMVVSVGTTVTWTNDDVQAHSATADDGSFNTGLLEKGESGSVTFSKPGKYAYHCSAHPNMVGTITVE